LKLRLKDQAAALQLLDSDPALKDLTHVRAPLVDVEVRVLQPSCLQYHTLQYTFGLITFGLFLTPAKP
jgi:hypothetical protein